MIRTEILARIPAVRNVVLIAGNHMDVEVANRLPVCRVNREIKRRTRVADLFPNEPSVLRLVTAILMEISEEWETGRACLTEQPQA